MHIKTLPIFDKKIKFLKKKNPNIKKDFLSFLEQLKKEPTSAIHIKGNVFKKRMQNSSNNKGKSSGYRVYYFYKDKDGVVVLLYIYTKKEFSNLSDEFVDELVKECEALF